MEWHVQYRRDTVDHIEMLLTPEAAIEKACLLIDDGCLIYGIGIGPLTDAIGHGEIAQIYCLWSRARSPYRK